MRQSEAESAEVSLGVGLGTLAALGLATVIWVPDLTTILPRGDEPKPNAAQSAATVLVVLVLTGAFVALVARTLTLSPTWAAYTLGYLAGIAAIKFVVSPGSFDHARTAELSEYLWVGLVVMFMYVAALLALYSMVVSRRPRLLHPASKAGLVGGVVVFAIVCRYVSAVVLGFGADEYLSDIFRSGWVVLLLLLAGSALAAIQSFEHARDDAGGYDGRRVIRLSLGAGLGVVAIYHGLWAAFMVKLFD